MTEQWIEHKLGDKGITHKIIGSGTYGTAHGIDEGYGAGKPEEDRLHIKGKRWQIRSKDAPKTPPMGEELKEVITEILDKIFEGGKPGKDVEGKYFHVRFNDPPKGWNARPNLGIVWLGDGPERVHWANTYWNEWTDRPGWVINRHDGAFDMRYSKEGETFDTLEDLVTHLDNWLETKTSKKTGA